MAETAEFSIDRLGAQGDGIAEWRGEQIFVPFTVPGDRVRARLGTRRQAGREARMVQLLVPGRGRGKPVCGHFGRCGGCTLQHLDAETYRAAKLAALHGAMQRAGLDPAMVEPLRIVPPGRRRARLGLFRPRDPAAPAIVGLRERFRHDLVDLRECAVLEPELFALLPSLRAAAPAMLPPAAALDISLTNTDSGVDMLIEAAAAPGLTALEALAAFAEAHDIARIVWRTRSGDIPIVERQPVRVMLSGAAAPFPPGGFLQASAAAEAILVAQIAAALGPARPALDLYAGLGTFTLALAKAGPVHAVEGDAAAAAALAQAAAAMPGVTVERRDLDRDPLPAEALTDYAAAVFDPPRAGAARQAAALAVSPISVIGAVSCNPATFVRDAKLLVAGGYRLERVVPVDQFVWTPHLELAAVFRR